MRGATEGSTRQTHRAQEDVCSDDASFVTGSEIRVDGGYLALGPEG